MPVDHNNHELNECTQLCLDYNSISIEPPLYSQMQDLLRALDEAAEGNKIFIKNSHNHQLQGQNNSMMDMSPCRRKLRKRKQKHVNNNDNCLIPTNDCLSSERKSISVVNALIVTDDLLNGIVGPSCSKSQDHSTQSAFNASESSLDEQERNLVYTPEHRQSNEMCICSDQEDNAVSTKNEHRQSRKLSLSDLHSNLHESGAPEIAIESDSFTETFSPADRKPYHRRRKVKRNDGITPKELCGTSYSRKSYSMDLDQMASSLILCHRKRSGRFSENVMEHDQFIRSDDSVCDYSSESECAFTNDEGDDEHSDCDVPRSLHNINSKSDEDEYMGVVPVKPTQLVRPPPDSSDTDLSQHSSQLVHQRAWRFPRSFGRNCIRKGGLVGFVISLNKRINAFLSDECQTQLEIGHLKKKEKREVLRFGRLFGPGKPSSLPQLWRGVKSKRVKQQKGLTADRNSFDKEFPISASKFESSISTTADGSAVEVIGQHNERNLSPEIQQAEMDKVEHDVFRLCLASTPPPEQCVDDDELSLLRPQEQENSSRKTNYGPASDVAPWRFGPARYWYDLYGVPESGEGLDYGFKLRKPTDLPAYKEDNVDLSEDSFLMFNLVRWEDEIIWDGEEVKEKILASLLSGRQPFCGWIPTQHTRTYSQFMHVLRTGGFKQLLNNDNTPLLPVDAAIPEVAFVLPIGNQEFEQKWEEEVIWDAEAMEKIPEPMIPTLDLTDPDTVYWLPEDKPSTSQMRDVDGADTLDAPLKRNLDGKTLKKSQLIAGRLWRRRAEEDEEDIAGTGQMMQEKDPFNLSNDEFYLPKNVGGSLATARGSMIQHSIPAQNLSPSCFPTYLTVSRLRHFHRFYLRRIGKGPRSSFKASIVSSLKDNIEAKNVQRMKERESFGGTGDLFWQRTLEDLSGKDGILLLAEYSEEHPPLVQQSGMASKIRNYYKRKQGEQAGAEPNQEYGEIAYAHSSPFLGSLAPGQSLQALENNLFRAPIYRHVIQETDFLLIRSRDGSYFVREISTIFTVGQLCPLYEVPSPNSKRATNFHRDFLLVFIYRLFWKSQESPRRIKMEHVRKAFPSQAESSIRKRLKMCADFKRLGAGADSQYWVLRPDFRLPSQDELKALVSPEMCCAHYSMLSAEQRLKDAGYGEKSYMMAVDQEDADDQPVKMEDEIKCAPWNTTRAYIQAMKGKCLLDLSGPADPTGCGEGFSYVRVSAKPPKEEQPLPAKKTVTGTDADLRKLSLKDAKQLLLEFKVPEEDIRQLTRWEIIDLIRRLSTQQARLGGSGVTKFARGNARFSLAEMHQRYKQECQRIFDLQNRILSNAEELSSDEEWSEVDSDSDLEEMGRNIESILRGQLKAKQRQKALEEEEQERRELQKLLLGESLDSKDDKKDDKMRKEDGTDHLRFNDQKLHIVRSFKKEDGSIYQTEEIVTRPEVVAAYSKLRTLKDENFIRHLVHSSQEFKDEKRKEKRRLQDRLRRLKKNEQKAKGGSAASHHHHHHQTASFNKSKLLAGVNGEHRGGQIVKKPEKSTPVQSVKKPPPPPKPHLMNMKCSACGAKGHMRTNKNCPLYHQRLAQLRAQAKGSGVALTEEELERELALGPFGIDNKSLVSVEGTKLKLKRSIVDHAAHIRRKGLILKFPRKALEKETNGNAAGAAVSADAEAAAMFTLPAPRPKIPKLKLARLVSSKHKFGQPAKKSTMPVQPVSAQLKKKQRLQKERLKFGGAGAGGIGSAINDATADYLKKPFSVAKPMHHVERRRADPKVSINSLLESILSELRELPDAAHFLLPVGKKDAPDYYNVVQNAMDLKKIKEKLSQHIYSTREAFLKDLRLILDNSALYNGASHRITDCARRLLQEAARRLETREEQLMRLEKAINPLLDDDEKAFAHLLSSVVERVKCVPKSFAFHQPVDKRKIKNYYERIHKPMDLGTIEKKIKANRYKRVQDFYADVRQIQINSELFNGPASQSSYTAKAVEIVAKTDELLKENELQLQELEHNIIYAKQREAEAMGLTSVEVLLKLEAGSDIIGLPPETPLLDRVDSFEYSTADYYGVEAIPSSDVRTMDYEAQQTSADGYDARLHLLRESVEQEARLNEDLAMSDSDEDEPGNKKVRVLMGDDDSFDFSFL